MKVLFWGASKVLKDFLKQKEIIKYMEVLGIVDSDMRKWGVKQRTILLCHRKRSEI